MKYLRSFFWLVLAVSIGGTGVVEASVVTDGVGALDQQEGMLLIELDRVSYQLGTPVCIRVVADEYALALGPDRVVVEITRLTEVVAVMAKSIYDPAVTSWRFNWQPPEETAGYGLTVWLEHGGGTVGLCRVCLRCCGGLDGTATLWIC
ncbi:MAG: hypothetical protein M0Q40_09510 [Limnochordia bacterium]|nr:hypothetical protein [Limnochordia bacterium]